MALAVTSTKRTPDSIGIDIKGFYDAGTLFVQGVVLVDENGAPIGINNATPIPVSIQAPATLPVSISSPITFPISAALPIPVDIITPVTFPISASLPIPVSAPSPLAVTISAPLVFPVSEQKLTTVRTSNVVILLASSVILPAIALAGRVTIIVSNNHSPSDPTAPIFYIGDTTNINAASIPPVGIPLAPGQSVALDVGSGSLYARSSVNSKAVTVTELAP